MPSKTFNSITFNSIHDIYTSIPDNFEWVAVKKCLVKYDPSERPGIVDSMFEYVGNVVAVTKQPVSTGAFYRFNGYSWHEKWLIKLGTSERFMKAFNNAKYVTNHVGEYVKCV